jgi:hypothetical protein
MSLDVIRLYIIVTPEGKKVCCTTRRRESQSERGNDEVGTLNDE